MPPSPFRGSRFVREPWRYRREATPEERQSQADREAHLSQQGDRGFGEDIYIDPASASSTWVCIS